MHGLELALYDGLVAGAYFLAGGLLVAPRARKANPLADGLLGGLLLCVGMPFLQPVAFVAGLRPSALSLLPFELPYALFGPLGYLAVHAYVTPGCRLRAASALWFAPAGLLALVVTGAQVFGWGGGRSAELYDTPAYLAFNAVALVWTAGLAVVGVVKLRRHHARRYRIVADDEAADLGWLVRVSYTLLALLFVWSNDFLPTRLSDPVVDALLLGIVGYISYHALFQPGVYPVAPEQAADVREVLAEAERDTTAAAAGSAPPVSAPPALLSDEAVARCARRLDDLMLTAHPHLDTALTLPGLAELAGLRPQELSFLLNHVYGESFYAFVNRHRVAAARALLADTAYNHLSLTGIATEAGFGSKTTFNKTFKALTGQTPSAWRSARACAGSAAAGHERSRRP